MTRPKEDGGVALTGDQDPQLLGRSDAPEALLSADSGEQFKIESWRVRVLRILIDCSENTRTLDRLEPRKRLKKFRVEAQFFRNSRGHQFNVADETCVDPGSLAQRQEISPLEEPVDFVSVNHVVCGGGRYFCSQGRCSPADHKWHIARASRLALVTLTDTGVLDS